MHQACSSILGEPRVSSKSQGAQSFLRCRWSTPPPPWAQYTLPTAFLESPPLQGSQDSSTPVPGRPGPHSSYRLLSLLLLRSLPLCLQLPAPQPPKSQVYKLGLLFALLSPYGVLSPIPCSRLIGSDLALWLPPLLLSITVPQFFPKREGWEY